MVMLLIFLTASGLAAAEQNLVADPHRAIKGKGWEIREATGRDYWQFFPEDLEMKWPDIVKVDFYRHGGRAMHRIVSKGIGGMMPVTKHNGVLRTLAIREMQIFNDAGANLAPSAAFAAVESEAVEKAFNLKALNDNDDWTTFHIRGPRDDARTRFAAQQGVLICKLAAPDQVARVVVEHGAFQDAGRIRKVAMQTGADGRWADVACKINVLSERQLEIIPGKPLNTPELRFEFSGWPYLMRFNEQYLPDPEHLKTHAFYVSGMIRANRGDVFSLTAENFDLPGFEKFLKDYADTFWGFDIPEWDSNIRGIISNPRTAGLAPKTLTGYTSKDEALAAWEEYFKMQKALLFDQVLAHSGGIPVQYGPAFGAKTTLLQTSESRRYCRCDPC